MAEVAKEAKTASSYKVLINEDRCKGCQLCLFYCPTKYLKLSARLNKRAVNPVQPDKDKRCIGCGFCFLICPETCIEIHEKRKK